MTNFIGWEAGEPGSIKPEDYTSLYKILDNTFADTKKSAFKCMIRVNFSYMAQCATTHFEWIIDEGPVSNW